MPVGAAARRTAYGGRMALTTGWEPHVAVGDTVLRRFLYNNAAHVGHAVSALGGDVETTDAWAVADTGRSAGFLNAALFLAPPGDGAAAALAERLRRGSGPVWLFNAWPEVDLTPGGWVLEGYPPLMLRPAGPPPPAPALEGVRVERVTDPARLAEFEAVTVAGYPLDGAAAPLFAQGLLDDPAFAAWLALDGGTPVGGAAAYIAAGLVQVTLVAVLGAARRRGVGAALTAAATRADSGLPAALLASDDGRAVYERLGYLPLLRLACWRLDRP
jgi:hypothetical protein